MVSDTVRGPPQRTRRSRGGAGNGTGSGTVPSAASSARNSAVFGDNDPSSTGNFSFLGLNPPADHHHVLRAAASRFSLNEQFAATRREYEFGFDDASSITTTVASTSAHNNRQQPRHPRDPHGRPSDGSGGVYDGGDGDDDDYVDAGAADGDLTSSSGEVPARDYYELLCLSRQQPVGVIPEEEIRAAYRRLFRLLDIETQSQPPSLRDAATFYLAEVQVAFETLVEPSRREHYLATLLDEDDDVKNEDGCEASEGVDEAVPVKIAARSRPPLQASTATDLGIRLEVLPATTGHQRRLLVGFRPVDFCVGHSTAIPIPSAGRLVESGIQSVQRRWHTLSSSAEAPSRVVFCNPPILTISGSAYGLSQALPSLSSSPSASSPSLLLSDRYQPLLPETLPRHRLLQLVESKPTPLVTLRLRQELSLRPAQADPHGKDNSQWGLSPTHTSSPAPDAVVELESDLLPFGPSLTARFARRLQIEGEPEPLTIETSLSPASGHPILRRPPRAGVALHRRVSPGTTAFLCADSGDWFLPSSSSSSLLLQRPGAAASSEDDAATCSDFATFSRQLASRSSGLLAFISASEAAMRVAPTVEVGCTSLVPDELGLLGATGRPLTAPADRGIKGLDCETDLLSGGGGGGSSSSPGNWTISAAASSGGLAAYARYGLDLVSALPRSLLDLLPFKPEPYHLEMELCTTTASSPFSSSPSSRWWLLGSRSNDGYLALRALRRVSPLSKLGVEVGLSPWALHISLYWSRLASSSQHRFKLPLLIRSSSAGTPVAPKVMFWAVILPLAGLAALDLFRQQQRKKATLRKGKGKGSKGNSDSASASAAAAGGISLADQIARRRAEADELTAVLAAGAQARQAVERSRGGLVVIGAKYGVPASGEEKGEEEEGGGSKGKGLATAAGGLLPWSADYEVADVTVAVAALVTERGTLVIPVGLRKSRVLGFWDPAPGRNKVLQVRYLYRGKEGVVEVRGREELRLPPLQRPLPPLPSSSG